ncbi:lethal(2) giant larvae protein homolog SRO77-like isoform X2 [Syzygium oleosum]|uniref:lethal(2) giant larvae protein homolog SRO77-like isoform X2 n=1 Tax=Syzygium oleosum TaxID=219896 RepID=UPI0011D1F620|nr:lethal(2) giant larvae protein homolog SRO77-like isoform X2 [Syzygium oleosum]
MFAKRLLQKAAQQLQQQQQQLHQQLHQQHRRRSDHGEEEPETQAPQINVPLGGLTSMDLDPRVTVHYGIPSTSSIMALDPIQSLLAIGTLDGRIKVIGGDNMEALFVSAKQLPFKHLEFLQNQGFLVSISTDNDIQVWDIKYRNVACTLQWESNITAFSVIRGTGYMYIGDENGMVFVLQCNAGQRQIVQLPYLIPADSVAEAAAISVPHHQSVVGVLTQPRSLGNRLLIAYDNGLIVLWDISANQAVLVRGQKDLQLKEETVITLPKVARNELSEDISDSEQMDKEISSLCWLSADGSVLAVGYVDGDILLWNMSTAVSRNQHGGKVSNDVVKLQIASGDRRLPVIVLHWSASRSRNGHGGQLFVYGGDEIGSEEVLTILSLKWASGIEEVKCIGRVDLRLNGSYADMVLLPTSSPIGGFYTVSLIVLTNPGQLHVYDEGCLSALMSQQDTKATVSPLPYPMVIPTVEPQMTVSHLGFVHADGTFSGDFSKIVAAAKHHLKNNVPTGHTEWPLTGGVPSRLRLSEVNQVERIYVAGYRDGSVRMWDATCPTLSPIYVLDPRVQDIMISGANAAVSAIDFCSTTLSLAVGNECGLVFLYKLINSSEETTLHIVTETENKVQNLVQEDGPQCIAIFSLLNSPIGTLKFGNSGTKLVVGSECGQVAVFDASTMSVLYVTDRASDSSSPVISLVVSSFAECSNLVNGPSESECGGLRNPEEPPIFILTKNAHVAILDSSNGDIIGSQSFHSGNNHTAISLHIIESSDLVSEVSLDSHPVNLSEEGEAKEGNAGSKFDQGSNPLISESAACSQATPLGLGPKLFVLLCCEDMISLHPLTSATEIDNNFIQQVNLVKPCCWTTVLKIDEKDSGLVIVYQTGDIEIRSLLTLEVVAESSLMSILRWNFKTNMDKMMSPCGNGKIALVNGCEFAFISLSAHENDWRIPDSLPCLHDEVVAAAVGASTNLSPNEKKLQETAGQGASGGIIKGFKAGEVDDNSYFSEAGSNNPSLLESIFSEPLMLKTSIPNPTDHDEVIELSIDDIEIDEPVTVSSSSHQTKHDESERKGERERLFEGASTDTNPRPRTREEIIAKYRKTGDASSAASQARDKLVQRQEKLERISRRTEELQSGAEDFASMASELAKRMENRKWWNMF